MVADGLRGEEESLRDLAVAGPFGDEPEDLELTRGQLAGIGAGRRARPAWDVPYPDRSQVPRDTQRVSSCADAVALLQRGTEVFLGT